MTRVRLHRLFAWLLLPMIGGAPAASRGQPAADESPADPFPLHRIVIPAVRVPAELQRQGTLVQMPRAEFESKVREAAQAQQALRQQPRIVKAIYSAEFSGQSLTGGSGQWSVHHAGAGPGILPIAQLNLALDKIKVANADGVFGDLDGKNLGLWIEQPGVHSVYFDWSLQGQARADGVAFAMRVPACLTNVLELKLPADHAVFVESQLGLASGPFDTERAAQKLWRIQTTGRSQIDFAVRKSEARAAKSLVFTSIESRQELLSAVHADFDVEIQAIPSASTELIFDHDVRLHPYEVTVRQADLKDWELMPAAPMTGHAALVVRLREPRQGALQVRIRCLASRTPNQAWISPGLRLRQAIPRGESLQIVVPSAQPVDHWEPGQFQLTRTGIDKNGNQILTLVDLDPEAATPRRPHLTLAPH